MNPCVRSYLFVPGDRPERFDKALASGAHAVILDLGDAVTPERKVQARLAIAAWLAKASARVFVRVNPEGTPWHADDCELLSESAQLAGLMVPKAEDPTSIGRLARHLGDGHQLIPLVETVAGHFEAAALARIPRVSRLAFGSFDFMADSGIQSDAQELDAIRMNLVLVSRHAGIAPPIDGVSAAIDDPVQLEADVRRSRRMGMGAKLCIHPKQVAILHAGFAPTPEEVAWARRVLDALASGPLGAVSVDGKLVDRPIALRAEAILAEAASASVG
ncbi:HpcH/HpaI aldolase/citrate lyase family protein [Ramlibacter alkalitolerans]|uniref:CoA ester lyase n=1 Tax=Ramlibacter alkalitolerans TaxID=2039631 RepID=A0ABS1JKJ6_9BURK|nr:CoA ester lyase [Ramlibacter alkalitolerans]MBL0424752.1 CoA ester lyase [Ramlibacter alkalitolerans]